MPKETVDRKKTEMISIGEKVNKSKAAIIQKEWNEKMPQLLEEGLQDLKARLTEANNELTPIEVNSYIRNRHIFGVPPKYSVEEMCIAFEYYKQYIEEINRHTVFPPTKKNFCGLLGISSHLYDSYRESLDSDMAEVMSQVDDYITDGALSLAQSGKIREVTTIFRSKAENKMVEAAAPIVVKHEKEVDLDKIMEQVKMAQKGRVIEVKGENIDE